MANAWTRANPEWPPCPECGRPVDSVTTLADGTRVLACFTCLPDVRATVEDRSEDWRSDREERFHELDEGEGR